MTDAIESMTKYVAAIECAILHPRNTAKQNQCRKDRHADNKISSSNVSTKLFQSGSDTTISCNPQLPEILFTNTPIQFKDKKESYITIAAPSGAISSIASQPTNDTFFCIVSRDNLKTIQATKKYDHTDLASFKKEPIVAANKDLLLIMIQKYNASKEIGSNEGPTLNIITIIKNSEANDYALNLLNISNSDVDISKIESHSVVFNKTAAAHSDRTFQKIIPEVSSNFLFYNFNEINLSNSGMTKKDFLMYWMAVPNNAEIFSPSHQSPDSCAEARAMIHTMLACKSTVDGSISGIKFYDSEEKKYTCKEGSKQTVLPAYYHEKTDKEIKFEQEMHKVFTESAERNRRNAILQSLIGSFISSLVFSAFISAVVSNAHRPSFFVLWIILFIIFFPLGYVASMFI
jgi:hypothetical protein